jgi:hypothetical protein
MVRYVFYLFALILLAATWVSAQPPRQPPPARAPSREVGNAKVFYIEKLDQTRAEAFSYIQGNVMDIYEKKKEVVGMSLKYWVTGPKATAPDFLFFSLTSYSAHPDKYTKNHTITIFVDGQELLSELGLDQYVNLPFLRSSSESFAIPRISYSNFEKMVSAKSISIQIGETKIDLKKEDMQVVKDLKKTIED